MIFDQTFFSIETHPLLSQGIENKFNDFVL